MVTIGFREQGFNHKISQSNLILIDIYSKLCFAFVLLPIIYLFGFLLRNNLENVFRNLSLFTYFFGHLLTMIILSIFWDAPHLQDNHAKCETGLFYFALLSPFTFNFFNPILNYFVCEDLWPQVFKIQMIYGGVHVFMGICVMVLLLHLE